MSKDTAADKGWGRSRMERFSVEYTTRGKSKQYLRACKYINPKANLHSGDSLAYWSHFSFLHLKVSRDILQQCMWYNSHIRVENKPILMIGMMGM